MGLFGNRTASKSDRLTSVVQHTAQSTSVVGAVRAKLQALEPLRSVYDIAPLDERIGDAYEQNRLRTIVISVFAVTALSLACLGVWGTLSYLVTLRRREIGLRLSLGAARRHPERFPGRRTSCRCDRLRVRPCAVGRLCPRALEHAVWRLDS